MAITASGSATLSVSTSVSPGRRFSLKKTRETMGRRRSASISSVLNPCWLSVAAKFVLQNVLPSAGCALVNMNERRSSVCDPMARDVRNERNPSATTLFPLSHHVQDARSCCADFLGMALNTGSPAMSSA